MELLVTGEQMKALDHFTIQEMGIPSLVLMERAGLAVFEAMKKEKFPLDRTLVLCGGGNNGADGVVIARLLFSGRVSGGCLYFGKSCSFYRRNEETDRYWEKIRNFLCQYF